MAKENDGQRQLLLLVLDEAYERKSWHGTNLKGSLRGLTPEEAEWRPHPARHNIVEIAVHAAYWKYVVRRRLRGEKRGSFPLKGSNWFKLLEPLDEARWRDYCELLGEQHRALRQTVLELPDEMLFQEGKAGQMTPLRLIRGAALHDVYHAGQVQTLKALWRSRPAGHPAATR